MSDEIATIVTVSPELAEANEAVKAIEAIFNEALTSLDEAIDKDRAERLALLGNGLDSVAYKAMKVTEYLGEAAVKGFSEEQTLRLASELGRLHAVDTKAKASTTELDTKIAELVNQRNELEGLMERGTPAAWRERKTAARKEANAGVREETTIGAQMTAKAGKKPSNNHGERPADLAALKAEYAKPQQAAVAA